MSIESERKRVAGRDRLREGDCSNVAFPGVAPVRGRGGPWSCVGVLVVLVVHAGAGGLSRSHWAKSKQVSKVVEEKTKEISRVTTKNLNLEIGTKSKGPFIPL